MSQPYSSCYWESPEHGRKADLPLGGAGESQMLGGRVPGIKYQFIQMSTSGINFFMPYLIFHLDFQIFQCNFG
jgi:hypothetical protein